MTNSQVEAKGIPLPELAEELQCRKQSLFKIAKRIGIIPEKRRDPDRKNQLVSTVSEQDAALIRKEFLSRTARADASAELLVVDEGSFYLIRLEPQFDPGRFKVGFTTDLDERLRKHRCSAPFAEYLKTWPCRRIWERTAIDCVTGGLEQLHTEVFRTECLDTAIRRADQFFELMPAVKLPATDLEETPV